jgi:hypothetical protein
MHLHAIPPHKVQKSPPLNVQSYTLVRHTVTLFPHWCNGGVGQVCTAEGRAQRNERTETAIDREKSKTGG